MAVATSALILASLMTAQTVKGVADARSQAKSAKKVAGFQAGILEEQADDAILIGQEAQNRSESATRQLTGAQRASLAASGVDISSGSADDVISNDEKLGEIEALTIHNNAAREALGLRKQAELVRKGGQAAAQGYSNQATSTLLSGATSLYSIYDAYGRNTTPRKTTTSGTSGAQGTAGGLSGGKAQR